MTPRQDALPLIALSLAQLIVWAAFFYLFPILLIRWEVDLGWRRDMVAPAFTLALFSAAVMAPIAGRLIDASRGGIVMAGCATLGAIALAGLSQTTSLPAFYFFWTVIGIAMGGCLYEPCFAFVTRLGQATARRRITLITLIAGFASTACFPLADMLTDAHGWRITALCFSGAVLGLAVPLFIYSTRWLLSRSDPTDAPASAAPTLKSDPARARLFWVIATSFPLVGLTHIMIISHIVPILHDRGTDQAMTVLAASMIGPMQVAGRIAITTVGRGLSPPRLTMICFAGIVVAVLVLLAASDGGWPIYVFVVLLGASYGILSIVRPLVTAELVGRDGFGAVSGQLARYYITATAIAPFAAAILWRWSGYDLVLAIAAGSALTAFAVFSFGLRRHARARQSD